MLLSDIDPVEVDLDLAVALVGSQFPRWAGLPIEPVVTSGTVNTLFRLGDEMVIRLPHRETAARFVRKEHRWLPQLGPHLPLSVPAPLELGKPASGFPWPWSIYSWLEGSDGWTQPIEDLRRAAIDLARFITDLQRIDPSEGPRPGEHNAHRGVPLADRDPLVRAAIAELGDRVETEAVARSLARIGSRVPPQGPTQAASRPSGSNCRPSSASSRESAGCGLLERARAIPV